MQDRRFTWGFSRMCFSKEVGKILQTAENYLENDAYPVPPPQAQSTAYKKYLRMFLVKNLVIT